VKSRTMRVILPILALVLIGSAVAAFLVVRAETATARPTANWITFHDYFGLFAIRYPATWTVDGGDTGGGHLSAREGGEWLLAERYVFTDTAHPSYQIEISATEIANSDERAYFCSNYRLGYSNSTFAGVPADNRGPGGIVFGTANGVFLISLGVYPGDSLQLLPPTPVPESQVKAEMAVYNPILTTLKPSSSQRLTC